MPKKSQDKSLYKSALSDGWDRAIHDAERLIQETSSRLQTLKAALSHFKERKESGEPFPCPKSKQGEAKS